MKPIYAPKLTEFDGWQNDMEYLADEAECKRRTEWAIAMYKKRMKEQQRERRRTVTYKRARLLQLGVLSLVVSLLFAWYVFKPILWAVSQWGSK